MVSKLTSFIQSGFNWLFGDPAAKLSAIDQIFWRAIKQHDVKSLEELSSHNLKPSYALIHTAVDTRHMDIALRALDLRPTGSGEDRLALYQKAYSLKHQRLLQAASQPTSEIAEFLYSKKEYEKLNELVIPHAGRHLDLKTVSGEPLIYVAMKNGDEKGFCILLRVTNPNRTDPALLRTCLECRWAYKFVKPIIEAGAFIDRQEVLSDILQNFHRAPHDREGWLQAADYFIRKMLADQKRQEMVAPLLAILAKEVRGQDAGEKRLTALLETLLKETPALWHKLCDTVEGCATVRRPLLPQFSAWKGTLSRNATALLINELIQKFARDDEIEHYFQEVMKQPQFADEPPKLSLNGFFALFLIVRNYPSQTTLATFAKWLLPGLSTQEKNHLLEMLSSNLSSGMEHDVLKYRVTLLLSWDLPVRHDSNLFKAVQEHFKEDDPLFQACVDKLEPTREAMAFLGISNYQKSYVRVVTRCLQEDKRVPICPRGLMDPAIVHIMKQHPALEGIKDDLAEISEISKLKELCSQKLKLHEQLAFYWQFGMEVPFATVDSVFRAKRYAPGCTLECLNVKLHEGLYTRSVPEVVLPEVPADVSIFTLLEMYKKIDSVTPKRIQEAINNVDDSTTPKTKEGLDGSLGLLLNRVRDRTPYRGTPDPREAFYKKLENRLRLCVIELQAERDKRLVDSLLLDLAVAGSWCAWRNFKEPMEVYNALHFDFEAASIEGLALLISQKFRLQIIRQMANELASSPAYVPHAENLILKQLANKRNVPPEEFNDVYAGQHNFNSQYSDEVLLAKFDRYHTDEALIGFFESALNGLGSELKEQLVDWFKEHCFDWFEGTLVEVPKPVDPFVAAKQVVTTSLRQRLGDHIRTLHEMKKAEEIELLLAANKLAIPNFDNLQEFRTLLIDLAATMADRLLAPYIINLAAIQQRQASHEEQKSYLDTCQISFEGWTTVIQRVGEENVLKPIMQNNTICRLGDFMPHKLLDPAQFKDNARRQQFASQFYDKAGRFTKEAALFFMLQHHIIEPVR